MKNKIIHFLYLLFFCGFSSSSYAGNYDLIPGLAGEISGAGGGVTAKINTTSGAVMFFTYAYIAFITCIGVFLLIKIIIDMKKRNLLFQNNPLFAIGKFLLFEIFAFVIGKLTYLFVFN